MSRLPLPEPDGFESIGGIPQNVYNVITLQDYAGACVKDENEELIRANYLLNESALTLERDNADLKGRVQKLEAALHMVEMLRNLGGMHPRTRKVIKNVVEEAQRVLEQKPKETWSGSYE
jgi:hypothetical protein